MAVLGFAAVCGIVSTISQRCTGYFGGKNGNFIFYKNGRTQEIAKNMHLDMYGSLQTGVYLYATGTVMRTGVYLYVTGTVPYFHISLSCRQ